MSVSSDTLQANKNFIHNQLGLSSLTKDFLNTSIHELQFIENKSAGSRDFNETYNSLNTD